MLVADRRRALDDAVLHGPLSDRTFVAELVKAQVEATSSQKKKMEELGGQDLKRAVGIRQDEAWKFLEVLRTVSGDKLGKVTYSSGEGSDADSPEWKLKEDTGRMRVLYKKGPEGTPLHSFCLEGIIDSDIPSVLCVAWEVPHFQAWWPEFSVPPFRITESRWLRHIRAGEDLSLVRIKVPWPFAPREVVMRMSYVECFDQDIVFSIMKTIPDDLSGTEEAVHGYSAKDVPQGGDAVRIGMDGGFILYRYSADQCYFRTIVEMDVKLPMVPPWVIDFISRPLSINGYKLFQKTAQEVGGNSNKASAKILRKLVETQSMYQRVKAGFERAAPSSGKVLPYPASPEPGPRLGAKEEDDVPRQGPTSAASLDMEESGPGSATEVRREQRQASVAMTAELSALTTGEASSSAWSAQPSSIVSSFTATSSESGDEDWASHEGSHASKGSGARYGGIATRDVKKKAKVPGRVAMDPDVEHAVESIDRLIALARSKLHMRRLTDGGKGEGRVDIQEMVVARKGESVNVQRSGSLSMKGLVEEGITVFGGEDEVGGGDMEVAGDRFRQHHQLVKVGNRSKSKKLSLKKMFKALSKSSSTPRSGNKGAL